MLQSPGGVAASRGRRCYKPRPALLPAASDVAPSGKGICFQWRRRYLQTGAAVLQLASRLAVCPPPAVPVASAFGIADVVSATTAQRRCYKRRAPLLRAIAGVARERSRDTAMGLFTDDGCGSPTRDACSSHKWFAAATCRPCCDLDLNGGNCRSGRRCARAQGDEGGATPATNLFHARCLDRSYWAGCCACDAAAMENFRWNKCDARVVYGRRC